MTKKQLTDLGFYIDGMGRVYHQSTSVEFRIKNLKQTTPDHFINIFHEQTFIAGTEYGKALKSDEIKKVLNIQESTGCNCGPKN